METKTILSDPKLVAYCGLYCGACRSYLKGSCPGCHENTKASWCRIRSCCIEKNYLSCAACSEFSDVREWRKFNNFFSKLFAVIFHSDRPACIEKIREAGYEAYASFMAENHLQSIRKGKLQRLN
jgi:hypothetical protein